MKRYDDNRTSWTIALPVSAVAGCIAAYLAFVIFATVLYRGQGRMNPDSRVDLVLVLLCAAAFFTAACWVFRLMRPALSDVGKCPHCGYSQQGLTSTRCPECGQAFA